MAETFYYVHLPIIFLSSDIVDFLIVFKNIFQIPTPLNHKLGTILIFSNIFI